jgi:toxin YoeB
MEIIFSSQALLDLQYWKKSGNKIVIDKITRLIEHIQLSPYEGIGKPEALKHNWTGYWSRRITAEHRIIYKVDNEILYVAQMRYHY